MGEKGYSVLKSLIQNKYTPNIEKVIIGEDKNVVNDFSNEIREMCKENKLAQVNRKVSNTNDLKAKLWIAISWRWIIETVDSVVLVVFHESLLPKYRGFAPLVNQLINGEKKIGVTALIASEEFDRGPILFQDEVSISYPLKIQEAIEIVSPIYAKLACELVNSYIKEYGLEGSEQNEAEATYSLWRDQEDYRINWDLSSKKIKRFIDAVGFPYFGAVSKLNGEEIIIKEANVVEDVTIENRTPGKLLFMKNNKPIIVCGTGLLEISEAIYTHNNKSILPMKKYRSRFN